MNDVVDQMPPLPTPPDEQAPAENLSQPEQQTLKARLIELMLVTLKIGATSFGAPTAHIAMMESEFVRKRKWLTADHFLDLLAAANIIPGPNASETCYHVGYIRAGYPGLLVAGFSFILPAFVASMILAWVYTRYGSLPQIEGIFYCLNPLVLAIVLDTTWRIGKASLVGWKQLLIFGLAIGVELLGVNEIIILLGCGVVGILLYYLLERMPKKGPPGAMLLFALPVPLFSQYVLPALQKAQATVSQIFWFFLRTGSVLFGSSLVLFALIEDEIVNKLGWLTTQQLTDAIAVGQITPGPVLSSSTFIGYVAGGFWGGVASTLGVFLPSFVIVAITAPLVIKMRENAISKSFLRGVNASVVALILMVSISLAVNGIVDAWTALLLIAGLAALVFLKVQPAILVVSGLALGLMRGLFF